MARIHVEPRVTLPDGSIMCCDNPSVAGDDVCATCQAIHIWDADGPHFEMDIPIKTRS